MSRAIKDRLFPPTSPIRRRKTLASESREHLFQDSASTTISPLHSLGNKPQRVHCPYCKKSVVTRISQSDSKRAKAVNAILWAGMGDPFALSAFDWCQNVDHYCGGCGGHLARKPYRRQSQPIPEEGVWEGDVASLSQLGRSEMAASLYPVSEVDNGSLAAGRAPSALENEAVTRTQAPPETADNKDRVQSLDFPAVPRHEPADFSYTDSPPQDIVVAQPTNVGRKSTPVLAT